MKIACTYKQAATATLLKFVFLKGIGIGSFIGILLIIFIIVVIIKKIKRDVQKRNEFIYIPQYNQPIIVVPNSRVQYGRQDILLNENSNMVQNGQQSFYQYPKNNLHSKVTKPYLTSETFDDII